jgi:deoxyribodipyrimidine photo-lyase
LANIEELSDVFTTYRKTVEPLRDHPRPVLPTPVKGSLPPYPKDASIPPQEPPFTTPTSLEDLCQSLLKPLAVGSLIKDEPAVPSGTPSAHPFQGGESHARERLSHLFTSGSISTYHSTRNGLLGLDFSTKLSAYLSLGCITARQIHAALLSFEDGINPIWQSVQGYGDGENEGTKSIRFELLWRDYMRLCTRKFGPKLFRLSGFKSEDEQKWASPSKPRDGQKSDDIKETIERFLNGTTGMGFIDASQRELYHTGYTSNRARQNVASFLAKHLKIDWRIGAEWYESMLIDYDLSSNWGNWQYLAGVGNDPRGEARIFNPVKQAFDYDPKGEYVKAWVPELRALSEPSEIFQAWTIKDDRKEELGLSGLEWVEKPLMRIDFQIGRRGRNLGRPRGGDRGGRGRGADGQRPGNTDRPNNRGRGGGYGGRGYGSSRGHIRGYGTSTRGGRGEQGGGREFRIGMVERESRDFRLPDPLAYYATPQYAVPHHY